nr:hypothetical protein HmN_000723400 [Hymenolepis microstoma]
MTNSALHSLSSKSVQDGTILIPTTVNLEKVNGKNSTGVVEESFRSACGRTPSSTSMSQDQQEIVLPSASSIPSGIANIQANLLHQSADLSLLHNALRSGYTTPILKETNTISTGSFRRPELSIFLVKRSRQLQKSHPPLHMLHPKMSWTVK